jgi:hypothetical protein
LPGKVPCAIGQVPRTGDRAQNSPQLRISSSGRRIAPLASAPPVPNTGSMPDPKAGSRSIRTPDTRSSLIPDRGIHCAIFRCPPERSRLESAVAFRSGRVRTTWSSRRGGPHRRRHSVGLTVRTLGHSGEQLRSIPGYSGSLACGCLPGAAEISPSLARPGGVPPPAECGQNSGAFRRQQGNGAPQSVRDVPLSALLLPDHERYRIHGQPVSRSAGQPVSRCAARGRGCRRSIRPCPPSPPPRGRRHPGS